MVATINSVAAATINRVILNTALFPGSQFPPSRVAGKECGPWHEPWDKKQKRNKAPSGATEYSVPHQSSFLISAVYVAPLGLNSKACCSLSHGLRIGPRYAAPLLGLRSLTRRGTMWIAVSGVALRGAHVTPFAMCAVEFSRYPPLPARYTSHERVRQGERKSRQ